MPIQYEHDHESEITLFGEVNFRNVGRRFGIKTDDRRRHMYLIGKTGMGKSTLMENMFLADIYAGHGCCYVDPHGDAAEKLMDYIPSHRLKDVVYFNPADTAFPIGFNILESPSEDRKHLVRDGLMGVFKKIWPDVWSARMEYIMQNCISALLDYPGATLLGISRMLADKEYRDRVVEKVRDPIIKTFWVAEFPSWSEKYATEAIAPVQNKVGQFLSSSIIRNIVAQVKSTIDIASIMDEGKILIANLSKGRVGEEGMRLLGGMLITKIQLAAQERQNIPEKERRDFYLYVDEFQNFANESFANILSEARKYRLNLIVAHQYMEQLEEEVREAVIGNVGTLVVMRVGSTDAQFLETEFAPTFTPEDLLGLAKYQMYLKLMVDGAATPPFSANTLPPIAKRTGSNEEAIRLSREKYAEKRSSIEEKVLKWAGMELIMQPTAAGMAAEEAGAGELVMRAAGQSSAPEVATLTGISGLAFPSIRTEEEMEGEEKEGDAAPLVTHLPTHEPVLRIRDDRMAAIQEAQKQAKAAAKMQKRPSFSHTCQRCGKVFELAVQLDPEKPIYCPECRDAMKQAREERGGGGGTGSSPRRGSGSSGGGGFGGGPRREDRPRDGGAGRGFSSSRGDRGGDRFSRGARPDERSRPRSASASFPAPASAASLGFSAPMNGASPSSTRGQE